MVYPPGTGQGVPQLSDSGYGQGGYGYDPWQFLFAPQDFFGSNQPTTPTIGLAQRMAAQDPSTLASTMGVKSDKANKIKKAKK